MCDRPEARSLQQAFNRLPNPEDYYVVGACTNYSDIELLQLFSEKMEFKFPFSDMNSLGKAYNMFGINFVAINSDKIYTSSLNSEANIDQLEQFLLNAPSGINSNQPVRELLLGSYPNPFNGTTTVNFNLASAEKCEIAVYNSLGAKVADLQKPQKLAAGSYSYSFTASNLPSGIYYLRLKHGSEYKVHKMNYIR